MSTHAYPPTAVARKATDPLSLAHQFLTTYFTDPKSGVPTIRYWQSRWYIYEDGRYVSAQHEALQIKLRNFVNDVADTEALSTGQTPVRTSGLLVTETLDQLKTLGTYVEGEGSLPLWLDGRTPPPGLTFHLADLLMHFDDATLDGDADSHTPSFFSINQLNARLGKVPKTCPRFHQFLAETFDNDQQRIDRLQEWMGLLLVPDTSFQKMLICVGEGRNGKSVLLSVIEHILGPNNVSALDLEALSQRFGIAATEGKLVNISADLSHTGKLDLGVLKKFIGGDTMTLEEKYKAPRSFKPTARLVLATNTLPKFGDSTDAIWRRIDVLPFERQVPIDQVNRALTHELCEEGDAIFQFMAEGLLRLRQQGHFTVSSKMEAAVSAYRRDNNPTQEYLRNHWMTAAGSEVLKDALYEEYCNAMHADGEHPISKAELGKEIVRVFPSTGSRRETGHQRPYYYTQLAPRS
jgi:P4 family phage/plasmid primase-like protien